MMNWNNFKQTLKAKNEIENHPHSQRELAWMFTSVQFEDTEIDFLDLIYGIVRAKKPRTVLETGTHLGLSALTIGFALKDNSIRQSPDPHLHTVEKNSEAANAAQKRFNEMELDQFITVHNFNSLDFIRDVYVGPPFELVYFDSSRSIRPEEYYLLRSRNLISSGCILLFHDTSRMRAESLPTQKDSQDAYLSDIEKIAAECHGPINFDLSRGIIILQWMG
jgi:predicted O-methyltransferase YrrM